MFHLFTDFQYRWTSYTKIQYKIQEVTKDKRENSLREED